MKRVVLVSATLLGIIAVAVLAIRSEDVKPEAVQDTRLVAGPAKEASTAPAATPKKFGGMTTEQRQELRQEFGVKFQACVDAKLNVSGPETDESVVRQECLTEVRQALGMID